MKKNHKRPANKLSLIDMMAQLSSNSSASESTISPLKSRQHRHRPSSLSSLSPSSPIGSRLEQSRVKLLPCLLTCLAAALLVQATCTDALWVPSMFQNPFDGSFVRRLASSARQASSVDVSPAPPVHLPQQDQAQQAIQEVAIDGTAPLDQQQSLSGEPAAAAAGAAAAGGGGGSGYGLGYGSILEMAGIRPQSIASLLNTVGDTGFRYFNIQDQCRNRAACDLGHMLYKKLSFVHNWLIRTSVRSLTDMNNPYTQSWMEGMLGRNCTTVYQTCRQSPLEGLMNLAILQQLSGQGLH